jgi:hypothetical protein
VKLQIDVYGRSIEFELDRERLHWVSPVTLTESDFPLSTTYEGMLYELFSDGTFAVSRK